MTKDLPDEQDKGGNNMANDVTRGDLKRTVKILKRYFKKLNYPFEFSMDVWKDEEVIENTNCYRYAFDMPWRHDDKRIMAFLGWSYGKLHEHVTGEQGFSRFEIDLKRMGFSYQVTDDEVSVPEKGYKIALYIYQNDFHFARQNADGRWSEKNGFGAPVQLILDDEGNNIAPSQVNQDEPYNLRVYHIYQK